MVNISTFSLKVVKESGGRYNLNNKIIDSPKKASEIFNEVFDMNNKAEEVLSLMTLNTKLEVTGMFIVSQGSINESIVHPREVFKRALLQNAAKIILAHNHPSGNPNPSKADVDITLRLHEAGKILGINLIDHIIIGDKNFISLQEKGIIN